MIPVRIIVENGEKLPISSGGKPIAIRLESGSEFLDNSYHWKLF